MSIKIQNLESGDYFVKQKKGYIDRLHITESRVLIIEGGIYPYDVFYFNYNEINPNKINIPNEGFEQIHQ